MADVTVKRTEEFEPTFRGGMLKVRAGLGVTSFGIQMLRFPPNFETPPHSHDHSEVFVVLEGSCVFDGAPMGRHDSTVVEANDKYGFTTGPDGVELLVVRTGAAAVSM